jgi:tetratricopeptide (TPR) repeat protein
MKEGEAGPPLEEARSILANSPEQESPDMADCLTGLAIVAVHQGDYTRALPLIERALAIRRKWKGAGSQAIDLARNLEDLAAVRSNLGQYAEAERLAREALEILAGADAGSLDMGYAFNSLGWFLIQQDKYAEAELLLGRASSLLERSAGPARLNYADCLSKLAILDHDRARYPDAERLYHKAIDVWQQVRSPDDPDVAMIRGGLAAALRDQGRHAEARVILTRAAEIIERSKGPDSLGLSYLLSNLGRLESAEGREEKAESLHRRALSIREKVLGLSHPEVAMVLGRLAEVAFKLGRYDEAESAAHRGIAILEKTGPPTVLARCLDVLAQVQARRGETAVAEAGLRRALSLMEDAIPGDHPDTAEVLEHIAALLQKAGRVGKARAIEDRARAMKGRQTRGADAPERAPAEGRVP